MSAYPEVYDNIAEQLAKLHVSDERMICQPVYYPIPPPTPQYTLIPLTPIKAEPIQFSPFKFGPDPQFVGTPYSPIFQYSMPAPPTPLTPFPPPTPTPFHPPTPISFPSPINHQNPTAGAAFSYHSPPIQQVQQPIGTYEYVENGNEIDPIGNGNEWSGVQYQNPQPIQPAPIPLIPIYLPPQLNMADQYNPPRMRSFSQSTPPFVVGAGSDAEEEFQQSRRNSWPMMEKPKNPNYCTFCKKNGESREYHRQHRLRDESGKIECPILRQFVCPLCGESGDNAHTESYCPKRPKDGPRSFSRARLLRYATGKMRKPK